ncbi:golgin subfamily A member 2-like isoform X2 [Branchiostoma floridae]|uniref:Golgin subfamily A member 2-like isoform X2 n=1 Tax=Branchiostoma floridae TaxID=7739 RepID=A0A9J7LMV9_BRAFL|nr:golgin subfamily A member 2-like isoform X2 [Branchiostoma floridae]
MVHAAFSAEHSALASCCNGLHKCVAQELQKRRWALPLSICTDLKQFQQRKTPSSSPAARNKKSDKNSRRQILTENHSPQPENGPLNDSPNIPATVPVSTEELQDHNISAANSVFDGPASIELPNDLNDIHDGIENNNKYQRVVRTSSVIEVTNTNNSNSGTPSNQSSPHRLTSSTESLRQISMQLNGLVSESLTNGEDAEIETLSNPGGVTELQTQNQELVTNIETSRQANQQLTIQLQELKSQNSRLQQELDQVRTNHQEQGQKEVVSLREQLQVHIQTIGILVAEKSELQTQLSHTHNAARQKSIEAEDYKSRLQASRQRLADLEREATSTANYSRQYEKANKQLEKEKDDLKMEVYKLNRAKDEMSQQNSELTERFQAKAQMCSTMEQEVGTLRGQLSMTELRVQQLSSHTDSQETQQHMGRLQEERADLERKVLQYTQAFQQLSAEREQLTQHYQDHSSHLQQQLQQLAHQVSSVTEERDGLLSRHQEMEYRIAQLEGAAVDETDGERENNSGTNDSGVTPEEEPVSTSLDMEQVAQERDQILQQYHEQVNDNAQLSRLVAEKEDRILELESALARLGEADIDRDQLLEDMQNDKATISRAMAQNKELKNQLGELQTGFIKVSNDKAELTEALQSERHATSELSRTVEEQEEELKSLREEVKSKEQQVSQLTSSGEDLMKQLMQQSQLADRMRHYEAQGQLTEMLQRELASAQETINTLSSQNTELKTQLDSRAVEENPDTSTENATTSDEQADLLDNSDVVSTLSAAIRQLEMERDSLMETFEDQRRTHHQLVEEMDKLREEQEQRALTDGYIPQEKHNHLQEAMDKLQERFSTVMRDKAELSDKVQELEHLNMQLSGETETIGEYITLYHYQRAALHQRAREKDEFITRLAIDREDMQNKLGQLQNLVMQMLTERGQSFTFPEELSFPAATSSTQSSPVHRPEQKTFGGSLEDSTLDGIEDYESDESSECSSYSEDHRITTGPNNEPVELPAQPQEIDTTARQIIDLIQEIKQPVSANFTSHVQNPHIPMCKCCTGNVLLV